MVHRESLTPSTPWALVHKKAIRADTTAFVGLVLFAATSLVALFGVGADRDQGNVYRILFVHVPCAWNAFLWVIVGGVCALKTLLTKGQPAVKWDLSSQAAMELGTLFAVLTLVTGSIWGRPTWGVWWDWDPRLTSTFVMLLLCCGYLLLREFTPEVSSRRKFSAFAAVMATVNVPLVYFSVNLWRSLHQPQTFIRRQVTASSSITTLLWSAVGALLFLAWGLYSIRRQALLAGDLVREQEETL